MIILPTDENRTVFSVHQEFGSGTLRLCFDYALQGYGRPESFKVVVPAEGELWYTVEDIKEVLSKVTVKIAKRLERKLKRGREENEKGELMVQCIDKNKNCFNLCFVA